MKEKINEIIRQNRLWSRSEAIKSPDTVFAQLQKNTQLLELIQKRGTIMVKILAFILILILPVFIISVTKADGVSLTQNWLTYEGYSLKGQSLTFEHDMGHYGYEISLQRTDTYGLNQQQGHLSIQNKLDISSISLGLYRKISFGKFYIKPIAGAVHTTANINTKLSYQDEFKVLNKSFPINLQYETFNSKTGILPMYGVSVGYSLNSNIDFFYSVREQGYRINSIGIGVNF